VWGGGLSDCGFEDLAVNSAVLGFCNLSFAYEEGRPVLVEVSGCLGRGERVALLGANGSGKSTLLHLLMGLRKPQNGVLEVFGRIRREEEDFEEVRQRIGLLFQDSDDQLFNPTVWDEMLFGPLNLGWSREQAGSRAKETLSLFGLEGYAERLTYRLSAGEKRMVALASLWVMEPEVLLLDEPTAGLDEKARRRFREILGSYGGAMIMASHDREFLESLVHRRWLLRAGRLEIE